MIIAGDIEKTCVHLGKFTFLGFSRCPAGYQIAFFAQIVKIAVKSGLIPLVTLICMIYLRSAQAPEIRRLLENGH